MTVDAAMPGQDVAAMPRRWPLDVMALAAANQGRLADDLRGTLLHLGTELLRHGAMCAGPWAASAWADYLVDAGQRLVLTADVLRQRGNRFIDHVRAGAPPVLVFDYEIVLDGRHLPRPVNHALARILPPSGVAVDPTKRPFVIVDPRAGHGSGIGGFKDDSQVGLALRAGHPVYFVIFFVAPEPGQTLGDVTAAEALFIDAVARRHPGAGKPTIIGNCQGGWAVMALAAANPEIAGPLVVNGAPLSYWAGADGKPSLRYLGGLVGGSWTALLLGDLGDGIFDGANLVANFELMNPSNTWWLKYYGLYARVDEEAQRFLDFERWWGGFTLMGSREMRTIVDNLFVGNRLSRGRIRLDRSRNLDLRRIRTPIVVFCSEGDAITPPQQALQWIADLYPDVASIRAAGQVIVYLIHRSIGHLGIFVSGAVARREHAQILNTLDHIELLPPGLYEMEIREDPDPPPGGCPYQVTLYDREVEDILAAVGGRGDEARFHIVDQVSGLNERAYDLFVSPWVRAWVTPASAQLLRDLHPLRVSRYGFSDLNPALWPLPRMAQAVSDARRPAASDNPVVALERTAAEAWARTLDFWRDVGTAATEVAFHAVYGWFQAIGAGTQMEDDQDAEEATFHDRGLPPRDLPHDGDIADAVLRMLLLITQARGYVRPDAMAEVVERGRALAIFQGMGNRELRRRIQTQTLIVAEDPEAALAAIPALLVDTTDRRAARAALHLLAPPEGEGHSAARAMAQRLDALLTPRYAAGDAPTDAGASPADLAPSAGSVRR